MILDPLDDTACLGALTADIRARVRTGDRTLVGLARELGSTAALVRWIRDLPQRDDRGDATDGPREAACAPTQRFRIGAHDPNCVERAATYVAVAELLDPRPSRWLSTVRTPAGALHTLPMEDGRKVVLDPLVVVGAPVGNPQAPASVRNAISIGGVRISVSLDRALRVASRAIVLAGPSLAEVAGRAALSAAGIPPGMLVPIERALRAEGLTLGLPAPR